MDSLYLYSEVLWPIAFLAATSFITIFVIWFWDYLQTENLLREARYRFNQQVPRAYRARGYFR